MIHSGPIHMLLSLLYTSAVWRMVSAGTLAARSNPGALVNVRVEGESQTTFEGIVFTRGHVVTTPSGGSHECNGLNNGENPTPGPTCTGALDTASKIGHFSFDGPFDPPDFDFDDFLITSIGPDANTNTQFWGLLLNFQFTAVGGCQQEVHENDQILWAFDAFSKSFFLKLVGPLAARVGEEITLTVTDGTTGVPISDASITGLSAETDVNGKVTVSFSAPGLKSFKASRSDSIRSNRLDVVVV